MEVISPSETLVDFQRTTWYYRTELFVVFCSEYLDDEQNPTTPIILRVTSYRQNSIGRKFNSGSQWWTMDWIHVTQDSD
jgi:hypothetical protein